MKPEELGMVAAVIGLITSIVSLITAVVNSKGKAPHRKPKQKRKR